MYLPSVVTKQPEVNAAVSEIVESLAPDVVRIRYNIDQDWSGDWAVYFRVLVSDEAAASRDRAKQLTAEVVRRLDNRIDFASMGVIAYYNFRSVSEQAYLREEAWA